MIEIPPAVVVLGVITGMTYGLLAVGLLLVYRASGVINFAHGNVGGVASAIMGRLSLSLGLPWLLVFPVAIAAGAGTNALLELGVMRRLRRAPRIMAVVATLGAAQLLLGLAGSITHIRNTSLFPPPFDLHFSVGALVVTPYYVLILVLSPVIVTALAYFLAPPSWLPSRLRSRYGPAMRAAADNPDAARTIGISTDAMTTMAWAISGALAAFTALLIAPARGFQTIDALGPDLLVRALAPAVLARMASLPVALAAGVGVGVFESVTIWNLRSPGWVDGGLFALILVGLLVRKRTDETAADSSWLSLPVDRALPEHLARIWTIRNLGRAATVLTVAIALALPVAISNASAATLAAVFAIATIGLSVTIVTGLSGQISLGQFALAGVGAVAGYIVFVRLDVPWGAAVAAAAAAGVAGSLVIGLPALRLRGLFLAVTSLAFAVMAPGLVFAAKWAIGTGVDPGRPIIGNREIVTARGYYYVALGVLVACAWLVHNVRSGGLGRVLRAIRDSEDGARSFGIATTQRKLQSFALAGLVAGLGGVAYAHFLGRLTIDNFSAARSVALLAMVVLGGVGRVSGAVLGAAYLVGFPILVTTETVQLLVSGVGVLIFVMYVPGGIAQLLDSVRAGVVRLLARRAGIAPEVSTTGDVTSFERTRGRVSVQGEARPRGSSVLLEADGITVDYGHVKALDGMSISIREGETVGVIGPNGSGKTTLFKVLSGFVRPRPAHVVFDHRNISRLRPEERARLGLIRSFQDSMLFPTLTVTDSVRLALELHTRTHLVSSVLGLPNARGAERRKTQGAMELIELLGLVPFRDKLVGELSTGTRRITEICCLLALRPRLLLLDEPSSGIAQSETAALSELLVAVKQRFGTTLVVIEHDMPLIMSISDRIVAMSSGRAIAEGSPSQVQTNALVVESYLGA